MNQSHDSERAKTSDNREKDHNKMTAILLKILRAFLTLFLAGAMIGAFHQYDSNVAWGLAVVLILRLWFTYRQNATFHRAVILILGTLLTGAIGVTAELWGIHYGYWTYHDLPNNRHFAYWLPFAWMLAFLFLYRIEEFVIRQLQLTSFKKKVLLALVLSATLPTWGEIVAIYYGVWSYSWGYQIAGVPLLAIALLTAFHLFVFLLFSWVCRKYQVSDPVFNRVMDDAPVKSEAMS